MDDGNLNKHTNRGERRPSRGPSKAGACTQWRMADEPVDGARPHRAARLRAPPAHDRPENEQRDELFVAPDATILGA